MFNHEPCRRVAAQSRGLVYVNADNRLKAAVGDFDSDEQLQQAVRASLARLGCPFEEVVDFVIARHADLITRSEDGSFTGVDDAVAAYKAKHSGFFTRSRHGVDFRDTSKKLEQLENELKAGVAQQRPMFSNGVDFSDRSKSLEQLEREYVQRARARAAK